MHSLSENPCREMSSLYADRSCFRSLGVASGGFNSLVNHLGQKDSPFGKTQNLYNCPLQ